MEAYYTDGRGRYGTGESYDWFWKYEDNNEIEILTSEDELWTYVIIDGEAEILRYNGNQIYITVPSVVDNRKVVSLNSTFDGFLELKSVVVPEGVISIECAFYGCESLEEVILPESLKDMSYAFSCCYSLKNIDVPSGVKDFPWAFTGTRIESMVFPQGTENIAHAFLGSEDLKYVYLPKTLTDSYNAFGDCETLEHVEIENGVKNIGELTFYNCTSLKELIIPESVGNFGRKCIGYMEKREYVDERKTGYKVKGEQIVPGFKMKGISGSAAEKYAGENGIEFERL